MKAEDIFLIFMGGAVVLMAAIFVLTPTPPPPPSKIELTLHDLKAMVGLNIALTIAVFIALLFQSGKKS